MKSQIAQFVSMRTRGTEKLRQAIFEEYQRMENVSGWVQQL